MSHTLSIAMGISGGLALLLFGIFMIVYYNDTNTQVVEIAGSPGVTKATGCASDNVAVQNTLSNVTLADTAQLITTDHGAFGVDWTPNPDATPPANGDDGDDTPPPASNQGLGTAVYYKYSNQSSKEQTSDACGAQLAKQANVSSKTVSLIRVNRYKQWTLMPMIIFLIVTIVCFGVLVWDQIEAGHGSS